MIRVSFKPFLDFHEVASYVYREHKEKIQRIIPSADIHHIGSTAIPESVTKGDVDLNVRVPEKDFEYTVDELKKIYEVNQSDNWTHDFASFKDSKEKLSVGIQVTVIGSKYDDFVKLRDLLINDPKLLEEYNQMKLKYEGGDMDEYRRVKIDFFEKLRKHF